jgi:hypothetical protein
MPSRLQIGLYDETDRLPQPGPYTGGGPIGNLKISAWAREIFCVRPDCVTASADHIEFAGFMDDADHSHHTTA